nr:MAG TPA: hypothetical protein [Caudoviricetes sp.]
MKENSDYFDIIINGLTLKFELFTYDYILQKLKDCKGIESVVPLEIPKVKPFSELKKIYLDEEGNEKYHFFAYIKFFEREDGEFFGIVGGKTNYPQPDIAFDILNKKSKKQDNRISRIFLDMNAKFSYSRKVLIINHNQKLDIKSDNQQALFLETYVQRMFNLLDS